MEFGSRLIAGKISRSLGLCLDEACFIKVTAGGFSRPQHKIGHLVAITVAKEDVNGVVNAVDVIFASISTQRDRYAE